MRKRKRRRRRENSDVLFVDDRTGSHDLAPHLRQLITPTSHVCLCRLDSADVAFAGNGPDPRYPIEVGIEVKRLGDVLQCIQDGRFAAFQLPRMHEHFNYSWLVVEEEIRADPKTGIIQKRITKTPKQKGKRKPKPVTSWVPVISGPGKYVMYRDLMHWLTTIDVVGGVRVVNTLDRASTALWIASLYWWWQKDFKQHRSLKVFHEHTDDMRLNRVAMVAKAFDGIGYDRAKNISRHFSSPIEFINAPIDRLQNIPSTRDPIMKTSNNDGLSKVLGKKLYEQIRENVNNSNNNKRR